MAGIFSFKCSTCGKIHEGSPSIGYRAPDPYLQQSLPYYPTTYALKTQVHPRAGRDRPYLILEKTDHPLSIDFHEGLSIQRAKEIAEVAMHRGKESA